MYVSRQYIKLAEFPETDWGPTLAGWVDDFTAWFTDTFSGATEWFKDTITAWLLNPLQALLAESPWYVTATAILPLAAVLGGYGLSCPPSSAWPGCATSTSGTTRWSRSR